MSTQNGLAIARYDVLSNMDDIERAASSLSKSGYFQDAREMAQCVTKILAGRELGFGPFASMIGVYIITGRPSFSANIIAAAIKKSGRYNYRVLELTDTICEIEYYENSKAAGRSRFTIEDARKAGTKNLDRFPRNMLFARAMSNGARWYCPDVFNGSPVYTPEELGANVDEEGNVIDASSVTVITDAPAGNGHAPMVEAAQQLGATTAKVEPDNHAIMYAAPTAKIGKNNYPQAWARLLAQYKRANQYEVDGILQKKKFPSATAPEDVIAQIDLYLDEKAAAATIE